MNPTLAQFSDWTLALLPRLLLYPGGVWMLAMWLALRLCCLGRTGLDPRYLIRGLSLTQFAAAIAWTAVALLPVPGASSLPAPADSCVLVGLLLFALVIEWHTVPQGYRLAASQVSSTIALSIAALAPLASGNSLLSIPGSGSLAAWLALASGIVGLAALAGEPVSLAGGVRWLGWLGLLAAPLWDVWRPLGLAGIAKPSALYLAAIVVLGFAGRRILAGKFVSDAVLICWGLAALALLLAVLEA